MSSLIKRVRKENAVSADQDLWNRRCQHKCRNKNTCGHKGCCKRRTVFTEFSDILSDFPEDVLSMIAEYTSHDLRLICSILPDAHQVMVRVDIFNAVNQKFLPGVLSFSSKANSSACLVTFKHLIYILFFDRDVARWLLQYNTVSGSYAFLDRDIEKFTMYLRYATDDNYPFIFVKFSTRKNGFGVFNGLTFDLEGEFCDNDVYLSPVFPHRVVTRTKNIVIWKDKLCSLQESGTINVFDIQTLKGREKARMGRIPQITQTYTIPFFRSLDNVKRASICVSDDQLWLSLRDNPADSPLCCYTYDDEKRVWNLREPSETQMRDNVTPVYFDYQKNHLRPEEKAREVTNFGVLTGFPNPDIIKHLHLDVRNAQM